MKTRLDDLLWLGRRLDARCLNLLGRHWHLAWKSSDCNNFRVAPSCDYYEDSEHLLLGAVGVLNIIVHCQLLLVLTVIYSPILP